MEPTLEERAVDMYLGDGAARLGFRLNVSTRGAHKHYKFQEPSGKVLRDIKEAQRLARDFGVTARKAMYGKAPSFSVTIKRLVAMDEGWSEERTWHSSVSNLHVSPTDSSLTDGVSDVWQVYQKEWRFHHGVRQGKAQSEKFGWHSARQSCRCAQGASILDDHKYASR